MSNESRPPPEATIVMQASQVAARATVVDKPQQPRRLGFTVHAIEAHWEITDGASGAKSSYPTLQEALVAARAAARQHWITSGMPTGVTVHDEGTPKFVALYGTELPLQPT
jgi:hypothetical protein